MKRTALSQFWTSTHQTQAPAEYLARLSTDLMLPAPKLTTRTLGPDSVSPMRRRDYLADSAIPWSAVDTVFITPRSSTRISETRLAAERQSIRLLRLLTTSHLSS